MRSVHNQPLQQHSCHLLLDNLLTGLREEVEQHAGEVVGVVVGVAQLVGDGIEEEVAPFVVQILDEVLENVHGGALCDGCGGHVELLGRVVALQLLKPLRGQVVGGVTYER